MRAARMAILLIALVVLAGLVSARGGDQSSPATAAEDVEQRNVVLILTDDMRTDELRYMPNVRRLLIDRGVLFTNAISPHPLCCPARAELVSGQYGHNSGVRHNDGRWGGAKSLRDPDQNVGRWLQAAGYRTSYHGKFLNGYERAARPRVPRGWTAWDAQIGGIYAYWKAEFINGDRYGRRYITHVMRERTGRTMRRFSATGAPFLTVINHVAPHATLSRPNLPIAEPKYADLYRGVRPPSMAKPSFNERDIRDLPRDLRGHRVDERTMVRLFRARIRSLRSVDDAVAATVRELGRLGELDETYIVFASDNGNALGEHRYRGKNKVTDEMLSVPLVIRGPGFEPGTVDSTRVSLVDLPATFVDWADAAPGRRLDGVSIERLRDDPPVRDTILVQTGDDRRDFSPGWAYRGVTTDRYLYAHRAGRSGVGILFDREVDPYALDNAFDDPDYAEVRRELARRTQVLASCSGAACNQVFGPVPDPS